MLNFILQLLFTIFVLLVVIVTVIGIMARIATKSIGRDES